MKSIRYVLVSTFLTLSIFVAWSYASCTKDSCKAVTCLNGGTCSGGSCVNCPKGIGGVGCEIEYRRLYAYTYAGSGTDDSSLVYINNTLNFSPGNDSNYTKMQLVWNGGPRSVSMPIVLVTNTSNGSTFTVVSTTVDTFTYTGAGTVTKVSASVTLTESHPHSTPVTIMLNDFTKQ